VTLEDIEREIEGPPAWMWPIIEQTQVDIRKCFDGLRKRKFKLKSSDE